MCYRVTLQVARDVFIVYARVDARLEETRIEYTVCISRRQRRMKNTKGKSKRRETIREFLGNVTKVINFNTGAFWKKYERERERDRQGE